MTARDKSHHAGGRPPKFDEPRRPITVTLPERTLAGLAAVDADRAGAIVKLVDATLAVPGKERKLVDVVEVAPGAGIILVAPSRSLRQIPWLKLAEVTPGRQLLTVAPGTAVEALEVALLDLLEDLPASDDYERRILDELRQLIGDRRRQQNITKFEMLYVRSPRRAVALETPRTRRLRPVKARSARS
jgi:hypothetical protein